MRIIIIDEKGWLKLPTAEPAENIKKVKERYGSDADFLIPIVRVLLDNRTKIRIITVTTQDDREYTVAVE